MKSTEFLIARGKNRIKTWLYFPDHFTGLKPAAVICHGIPGGIPDPQDQGYVPLAERITANGFVCALFNFSGCGDSSGDIDMRSWHADLVGVHERAADTPGVDPRSIHAVGFSAGGAVAAKAACHDGCFKSLLLMATPADFAPILPADPAVLREHFRAITVIRDQAFPPDPAAWHRGFLELKAARFLPFISPRPVGIVHGTGDTVVPVEHAHELYRAACLPKKLTIMDGAPHQLRRDARVPDLILEWLGEVA